MFVTTKQHASKLIILILTCILALGAIAYLSEDAQAATATYENPRNINDEDISITLSHTSYYFNGITHKPTVKVVLRKLVPPPDPEPEPEPEPEPGTDPEPSTDDDITSSEDGEGEGDGSDGGDGEGDGEEIIDPDPEPVYKYITLIKGTNYTVSYSKGKYPGTATVTVKGIGKYCGTVYKKFTVISRVKKVNQFSLGYPYGCEMVNAHQLISSRGLDASKFYSYVKAAFPTYYKGATGGNVIGTASQTAKFINGYMKKIGKTSKLRVYAKKGYSAYTLVSDANKGYPCLAIVSDPKYREHCVSVVGGTSTKVALMDSIRGYRVVSMTTFKKMYAKWHKQSVRISR